MVDLNLNGTWNMTSRFMGPMTEAGFGSIVNVVHTFSFERGAPMFVHSGAARAGVVNMVKTLAPYLMRRGVTVDAFAPGIFSTPGMVEAELATVGRTEVGFTQEMVAEGTTIRMGTVDEMAAAVLFFLCSPAARYVCGATIIADGASMQTNWVNFSKRGLCRAGDSHPDSSNVVQASERQRAFVVEEPACPVEVARSLLIGVKVPLRARHGKEVATVHVEGHGELTSGVGDGVDDIVAEHQDIARRGSRPPEARAHRARGDRRCCPPVRRTCRSRPTSGARGGRAPSRASRPRGGRSDRRRCKAS